jgi:hypothetical protein
MPNTILDRAFEPISLNPLMADDVRLELRIHGTEPHGKGDRTTLLTANEMRLLAYRLLAAAEALAPSA